MSIDKLFDDIVGGMTKEEAFYALLSAAMLIDGERDDREAEELQALTSRTRTLSALGRSDIKAIVEKITPRLERDKIQDLILDACTSLKQEKAEVALSVFAHACDIVFADRIIRNQEKVFLKTLIEQLNIPEPNAEMIFAAIKAKNEH